MRPLWTVVKNNFESMPELIRPTLDKKMLRVIEAIRKGIYLSLDKYHGHIGIGDLPAVTENLEDFAVYELLMKITDLSMNLFNLRAGEADGTLLDTDDNIYHVYLSDDATNYQVLNVAIMQTGIRGTLKRKTFQLRGFGRYKKIRFFISSVLDPRFEFIEAVVNVIFDETYGWYKNKVKNLVGAERASLAKNLYSYLANIFPDDEIRQNFWFGCVTEEEGFRLIDQSVALAAFKIVDQNSYLHGHSTNRLVAEILTTVLPRQKLLMQRAVTLNRCVDADLSQAQYKHEGSIYASALEALYGSERFTVCPILTEGKICVVTLFPTPLRSFVEPILFEHRAGLVQECERSLSFIKRLRAMLEEKVQRVPYGKTGEMIGGIIKSFIQDP